MAGGRNTGLPISWRYYFPRSYILTQPHAPKSYPAHGMVCLAAQVEKLNTSESLYGALVRALDRYDQAAPAAAAQHAPGVAGNQQHPSTGDSAGSALLSAEALRVGRSLCHDMEKAGIHLPHAQRNRLTQLIGLERRLGMAIGKVRPARVKRSLCRKWALCLMCWSLCACSA